MIFGISTPPFDSKIIHEFCYEINRHLYYTLYDLTIIKIVSNTANAFAEDVQAALNAGMNDHVAKPIDMEILISVITKYIER